MCLPPRGRIAGKIKATLLAACGKAVGGLRASDFSRLIHDMNSVAPHHAEPHGDHLAAFGVVAEPRRAGHADELI